MIKYGVRDYVLKYVVYVFNGYVINIIEFIGIVEDMIKKGINILFIGIGMKYQDLDVLKMVISLFYVYFFELDFLINQWNLINIEFEFVKKFNS